MAEKRPNYDKASVPKKKAKIQQMYKIKYTDTWPVLTASKKRGVRFVHCCVCLFTYGAIKIVMCKLLS